MAPESSPDCLSLLRLEGRGCVVLGAGPGLGRTVAAALVRAGAGVLCVDRDEETLRAAAEELGQPVCRADITKREEVERVMARAEKEFGRVFGVVDIVGANRLKSILDYDDEDLSWLSDMVLGHAYLALQVGARAMAGQGGAMVFIGSNSGLVSFPNRPCTAP